VVRAGRRMAGKAKTMTKQAAGAHLQARFRLRAHVHYCCS